MKRLLFLASAITFLTQSMFAQMRYDLVSGRIYSHPEMLNINQAEYLTLFLGCVQIAAHMKEINGGIQPPIKNILDQCDFYLKRLGTPTALRLIADLKANAVYYANGSFMDKIF